jgi:hypothetical protein
MSDKPMRWSDRNARPSGCAWILIAGLTTLVAGIWPIVEAIT